MNKVIKYIAIVVACLLSFSIIVFCVRLFVSIVGISSGREYSSYELSELKINDNTDKLNIELSSADLSIKSGDTLSVETSNKYIKVSNKNRVLYVSEEKHSLLKNDSSEVVVYVPDDFEFDYVDIDTGAGRITIDSLNTQVLNLDLGAGRVQLNNILTSTKADIDTGAGKTTINNSRFNNLDLDCGVGMVSINSSITGDSTVDAGVGSLELNLLGNKDDYKIKVDKGIGSFKIDGVKVNDNSYYGEGSNTIKISGGVGSIKVLFNEVEDNDNKYTRTYTVISKVSSNEENKYYVTLSLFQGEVETVLIEDSDDILKVDKTYEFTFIGKKYNSIKKIFKNCKIDSINETDKTGLDQIQE